ncbi:hypothetical protein [Hymenobacter sp.]|uniref:hypothetical protein n=1 Tax=Hymenobacter sp. TaxID=1898978 RepID=UPI00286A34E5|nr:hypothetical protein [Hymenobacter sp.]
MENEHINLNTEENDIAGNRVDGPIGNTAAKPGRPGAGTGIPGGAPASPKSDISDPAASASSESLAESEMSAGQGALGHEDEQQENKEAAAADLAPQATYGGNFSNSTQGSYHDQDRRENQDSDANRGEFGAQDLGGTTHGGFGNQNRQADYEPGNTPEDRYYGGAGAPGPQENAYRAYDGRDERPDSRTEYGFERGATSAAAIGQAADGGQVLTDSFNGPNADNRNQPDRADPNSAHQNDNGSAEGPDSAYANDYGRTSLRGAAGSSGTSGPEGSSVNPGGRNQTEDYLPTQGGFDKQGRREERHPGYSTNTPEVADQRGSQPASSQGYGDLGRDEPNRLPDYRTGAARDGYVGNEGGDTAQGMGSRGGSYNDAYDDSRPGSKAGSPAPGDQRREDTDRNYGAAARKENRTGDENDADHGAPRRNAGREGEADE